MKQSWMDGEKKKWRLPNKKVPSETKLMNITKERNEK